jgi:hypothetical protein
LRNGLKKVRLQNRTSITDLEFASVAIAYNTGGFNPAKGLKQGFFDGEKFYGERIADLLTLSRSVQAAKELAPGPYVVIARGGLKLRGGPGTNFDSQKTLPAGTVVNVLNTASQDPAWAHVDLEGDGLSDGFVFASFLAPAGQAIGQGEAAPEPP